MFLYNVFGILFLFLTLFAILVTTILVLQRKREVSEAQSRLASIIEFSDDAIISKTLDGFIISWNAGAERIYGYKAEEAIGKNCSILFPPDVPNELPGILERVKRGEHVGHSETVLMRKDGSRIDVSLTLSPVKDSSGQVVAASAISRDITDRKRAEETLLAYQSRLRSLASELSLAEERERRGIATDLHDSIGQNLALIKIKLGAVRELASSTEFVKPLEEIGKLLEKTIQNTRSLTFQLSTPVLYELGLEAAVESLCEQFQTDGILIEFTDDRQSKPVSNDIRIVLFRAVRELLVNVTKHARARSVRVSIRRQGPEIQIAVEDDGVGFDVSTVSVHSVKSEAFGIFNIRERLQYLGGRLMIDSEPGRGTRVTLFAPLESESNHEAQTHWGDLT